MRLLVTSKFVVVTKRLVASLAAKRFLTWNEKKSSKLGRNLVLNSKECPNFPQSITEDFFASTQGFISQTQGFGNLVLLESEIGDKRLFIKLGGKTVTENYCFNLIIIDGNLYIC